jgi:HD-like signal output (HDOD) protein
MSSTDNQKFDVKAFALELREDIQKNRIRLPTLPNISLEALIIINDADSSMADLENVIAKDTSMAARLVRYANSPLYMGINNVSSVKAAITRIGLDAVKNAILSLAMRDVFSSTRKSIEKRMESLWQHSVSVASKATVLAEHFSHLNPDEAMLAGLIHDIGTIPILLKASDQPLLLDKEEHLDKVVEVLHMSVGSFMLKHWNFEPPLVEVAAVHDKLDRKPPSDEVDYVDIIQVANVLSRDGTQHRYGNLDLEKVPAFKRVGPDLISQVLQQAGDEGTEQNISTVLD